MDVAIEFSEQNKANPSTPLRAGKNMVILAPVVYGRKGEYCRMFYAFRNAVFS